MSLIARPMGDGMNWIFLAAILCAMATSAAQATSVRTFVATTGADSGGCARAAPCRSFAFAIDQTTAGGEIDVLDSGGFGPVTITKSITLVNEGNVASIAVAFGSNGVTINAGTNDDIVLRGLTVEGGGIGGNGIVFLGGRSLTVRDSAVQNFFGDGAAAGTIGHGILLKPASGTPRITIRNVSVSATSNAGIEYRVAASSTAVANVVIDDVVAMACAQGFNFSNNASNNARAFVSISNFFASSLAQGIAIFATSAPVVVAIDKAYLTGNVATGLSIFGTQPNVYLSNSTIMGNATGVIVNTSSAKLFTYENNRIEANTTNFSGNGALTPVTPK